RPRYVSTRSAMYPLSSRPGARSCAIFKGAARTYPSPSPDTVYSAPMNTALEILQHTFGYASFRPPQDEIIQTVIDGGDALVVMPVGAGQALCDPVLALARRGCCIVVSLLVALMQDQVDALRQLGVRACYLNSTLSPGEARQVEDDLLRGE